MKCPLVMHRCVLVFAIAFGGGGPAYAESVNPAREYQDMLRADLIVRGTVAGVTEELVPAGLVEPKWTRGDYCRIAVVGFSVDEVVFGVLANSSLDFIVNLSNSDLQGTYQRGDEMVVSLAYRPEFRGGAYFVNANEARFVLSNGAWMRQGYTTTARAFTLEEIRSIVAPSRFEQVSASASIVAIGVVNAAKEELVKGPNGGAGRIVTVVLQVDEIMKGMGATSTLEFLVFNGGTYWPSWAEKGPRQITVGQRYCVFLKEIDGKLHSAGGVNGFFRVEGDLLIRNQLPLPVNIPRVRVMLE